MINRIIAEINKSIENECYIAALTLALTLPDICGKAEYPKENNTPRYIKWYNSYMAKYYKPSDPYGSDMPYLSGEMVYNLRCSLLHQGKPNIETEKIKEERCKIDRFVLLISSRYDSGTSVVSYGKDMQICGRRLEINALYLCKKLCSVAKEYYQNNAEKFIFFQYELKDVRQ